MATDFKMHIYNENFICVSSIFTDAGVVQQAQYYDKMDSVVTAGMNGCIILQLQIKCKYDPETAIQLDPQGFSFCASLLHSIKLDISATYIKGIYMCDQTHLLAVWSTRDITFFSMKMKGDKIEPKEKFHHEDVCEEEDQVTQICHVTQYNYYLVGTKLGHIKILKLASRAVHMHSFPKTVRAISTIIQNPRDPSVFMAASLDGLI